jgi:two-component system OmpR family response regulator
MPQAAANKPISALLIEDDKEVNAHIAATLKEHGHSVESVFTGDEGMKRATTGHYDVMIIDRMLPGTDGLSIIRSIREKHITTPVLILSALGEVDDRVTGLKSGGDDYLVKPYAAVELLARVEVLARRGQPSNHSEIILQAGDIVMDILARKVTRNGKNLMLQAREFKLLEFLVRHKNQIVTRAMLLEHVWEYHFDPQTNVIDVHISRLRQKIDTDPAHSMIKTIRGSGYMVEDTAASHAA